jgi:putative membrane protein
MSVGSTELAGADNETKDASRRTRLANERTYLAWWRTGLAALAVCIGLGRIVPGVAHVTKWPYEVLGGCYGLLGIGFIVVGHLRLRSVEAAVRRGEFVSHESRLLDGLLVVGVVLGLATVAMIVFGD